jgi:hypothetical protein
MSCCFITFFIDFIFESFNERSHQTRREGLRFSAVRVDMRSAKEGVEGSDAPPTGSLSAVSGTKSVLSAVASTPLSN